MIVKYGCVQPASWVFSARHGVYAAIGFLIVKSQHVIITTPVPRQVAKTDCQNQ